MQGENSVAGGHWGNQRRWRRPVGCEPPFPDSGGHPFRCSPGAAGHRGPQVWAVLDIGQLMQYTRVQVPGVPGRDPRPLWDSLEVCSVHRDLARMNINSCSQRKRRFIS